jgi:hypothetical protein
MNLEEQAEFLSDSFGWRHSRVYDLILASRLRLIKSHPIDYVLNRDRFNERAYSIAYRYVRFHTYMAVGRD